MGYEDTRIFDCDKYTIEVKALAKEDWNYTRTFHVNITKHGVDITPDAAKVIRECYSNKGYIITNQIDITHVLTRWFTELLKEDI